MGGHFASAEVGGVGACVRGLKVASSLRSGVEVCNAGCAVDTVASSSGEGAFDPKPSYSNGSAAVEEAKANWLAIRSEAKRRRALGLPASIGGVWGF